MSFFYSRFKFQMLDGPPCISCKTAYLYSEYQYNAIIILSAISDTRVNRSRTVFIVRSRRGQLH